MKKIAVLSLLLGLLMMTGNVLAQYPDDALRLSTPGLGVGARALGMGNAYTGVASDFSAIYANPAGLGQIRLNEVQFGMSNVSYNDNASFEGNSMTSSNSSTDLNDLGFVYPFPAERGSFVIAAGFTRSSDFTTGLSFNGFNSKSSIAGYLPFGLAYDLGLQDSNGNTQINGHLQQNGTVLEGGGINTWSVGLGFEAARQLYLGVTLSVLSGSYAYTRNYSESDVTGYYQADTASDPLWALQSFNIQQTINDDIGGVTAKLGLLYKFTKSTRLGITVKLPTYYSIHETFTNSGNSQFYVPDDNGNTNYSHFDGAGQDYNVTSPYVFDAGLSTTVGELLLSGEVEYTDWTEMSFSNLDPETETADNTAIKQDFKATTNLRAGAEYEFPGSGFMIRGGFQYLPSPYQMDNSSNAQKVISGGVGFLFAESMAFNFAYAYDKFSTSHINYPDYDASGNPTSQTLEDVHTNTILGTLTYRF
jgi:hypothetical protein